MAITLPWKSTFNCPDWNQYSDPLNCDGFNKGGNHPCQPNGYPAHITSAANYPGGDAGKGLRIWIGDGSNNFSGGVLIKFVTLQPEFWMRWYFRYQAGFKWGGLEYHKLTFWRTDGGTNPSVVTDWHYNDGFRFLVYGAGSNSYVNNSNCGWNTIYPTGISDGSWHFIEIHLKIDTNGSNGICQYWLDGVLKIDVHNANLGGTTKTGFDFTEFPSNQATPANGGCAYYDLDDVEISNTGYIGPIGMPTCPPVICDLQLTII